MNVFVLPLLIAALYNNHRLVTRHDLFFSSESGKLVNGQPYVFQFYRFKTGLVIFRNHSIRKALMNYNFLHGKLQFIDEHKDTLLLTNKYQISRVVIDEREFIPGRNDKDDDMEIVSVHANVKLARLTKLVSSSNSSSASVQQFKADSSSVIPSSLFISNKTGEFQWQNTALPSANQLKTTYYFIDKNGKVHSASLKSIHKLYQKQSAAVRSYSKTHKVNYTDVTHVANFLNYLEAQNQ